MAANWAVETSAIARDFDLPTRSIRPVLSVVGHYPSQLAGLFPDVTLVSPRILADAILQFSRSASCLRRSPPLLRAVDAFLRVPRIRGGALCINSITLSRISNASSASWCERVLMQKSLFTAEVVAQGDAVRRHVLSERIGGTWWGISPPVRARYRRAVFAGRMTCVTRKLFFRALQSGSAAETILVLPRPDRLGAEARRLGALVLEGPVDPWPLLEAADDLYAQPQSDVFLAARLLGRSVTSAGTDLPAAFDPTRLATASLVLGARYANPFTGKPSSPENFLDILSDMRRGQRTRSGVACCVGISFWKRRRVGAFVGAARRPSFRKTAAAAVATAERRGGSITVWPSRAPAGLAEAARDAGVPLLQMEDGFIRSVGLGADFFPPLSLVLDQSGLYYDATRSSDLEALLATASFGPSLLRRAAALRSRIVADRITKYNLSTKRPPTRPAADRVILVPGQVADDRSVLLGGGGVRPGLDLLHRVRQQAPDAHIIYKPHPDVMAGHRAGAVEATAVLAVANQILHDTSIADVLEMVDEVHTLTSLAGFEALLRFKPVTTYGQPFYAGWGLTTDLQILARRTRKLGLDELVAGVLILYPSYIDPVTLLPCGPETAMDRLRDPALHRATWLVRARRAQGRLWERMGALAAARGRRSPGTSAV